MKTAARPSHLSACLGTTPLVELTGLEGQPSGVRLVAKLEGCHPGGSIKDRPVAAMMADALASGALDGEKRLLDSSSGNAGIAYAMLGAAAGIGVTLVVPGNASAERLARIRAHGAELILTDPVEGYDFAVASARRLAAEHPDRYVYIDQYSNPANWRAHYDGTACELLDQLASSGGPPDAFVCGIGTGGTLTGVGRRLREVRPDVRLAIVEPEPFPGIEGLKPLGRPGDLVPEILDSTLIDERVPVSLEEAAETCRELALRGLFVGPSSGANVRVALEVAARHGLKTVATVLPDGGDRYLSTGLWPDGPPT